MTHETWQQTREGRRVLFQLWLASIERAAYRSAMVQRDLLGWRDTYARVGSSISAQRIRELEKKPILTLKSRDGTWNKLFPHTVMRPAKRSVPSGQ